MYEKEEEEFDAEKLFSQSVWESSKDEAGLIVAGVVLGGAVGVGGGAVVSQLAGTPMTASLVVGGVAGAAVGGTVATYEAHRLHEVQAQGLRRLEGRTRSLIAYATRPAVSTTKELTVMEQIAAAVKAAQASTPATPPAPAAPAAPVVTPAQLSQIQELLQNAVEAGISQADFNRMRAELAQARAQLAQHPAP